MYRVFIVTEGLSLVEDISPTVSVSALQSSLGRKCGVRTKDVILLSSKGHLLDSKDVLGAYDAGTEEKPVFVFLRPDAQNQNPLLVHTPYKKNLSLHTQLSRLTSSPSPAALQHQLGLGKLYAEEALKLSSHIQELRISTNLQRLGWLALTHNFSSNHRTFEKHHRALNWGLVNLQNSKPSYEELLAKSPQQLEVLKKIVLSPSLGQGVFDGYSSGSLYDWISSQDEHSSLPDLIRECREALDQIDETSLTRLQSSTSQLMVSTDKLAKFEAMKELGKGINMEEVARTTQEQQSMAQSLQATIQKVLGSGDAGALANVSLSNQRLVQLMHRNHQVLEGRVEELEMSRRSIKEVIEGGLKSVASLQQQMMELDTQLLFHCEHLQLTRRRFEVLEQICASPETLAHVIFEIKQRKRFKEQYTEYAHIMAKKLESFRQQEKVRRQRFLESYSQHFVLSLFPSFTDRIPHLMSSSHQSFDDDLCFLSTEVLKEMSQWLPHLTPPPSPPVFLMRDGISQTEDVGLDKLLFHPTNPQSESKGVQALPQYRETESQVVRETLEAIIQTEMLGTDSCVQTIDTETMQKESQTEVLVKDMSVQTVPPPQTADAVLQVSLKGGVDSYTQTAEREMMVDTVSQTELLLKENGVQTVPPLMADVGLLVKLKGGKDTCVQTLYRELADASSQTLLYLSQDSSVQTMAARPGTDVGLQIMFQGEDVCLQTLLPNVTNSYCQTEKEEKEMVMGGGGEKEVEFGVSCDMVTDAVDTASTSSQTIQVNAEDSWVQTVTTESSETSCQTQLLGVDKSAQTVLRDSTSVSSQTQFRGTSSGTQTRGPDVASITSQTQFQGQHSFTQTSPQPEIIDTSSQTENRTAINEPEGRELQRPDSFDLPDFDLPLRQSPDYVHAHLDHAPVIMVENNSDTVTKVKTEARTSETEPGTSSADSRTDLEGQVVALNAAVSGLKAQLMTERESHRKQVVVLEREVKQFQRSRPIGRESEDSCSLFITVGGLNVGDTALFLQDIHSNFLALTVDGRIYYLNHTSAERFKTDISSRIQAPLRRKVLMGTITEKLLVEVRKESNRLKVPVGQRLYKVSAREATLP